MSEFFLGAADWASAICYAGAAVGCLYALFAAWAARGFVRSGLVAPAVNHPAVTILKPLHGAEPDLCANLVRFCDQDYTGSVQIVFGVDDPADPAVEVARRAIAAFPDRDLKLVVNSRRHGTNRKVSNLINMLAEARHEILVISDSDIVVGRDYLKSVVGGLDEPSVGAVTCLYRGTATSGGWAHFAAAAIDYHFLPSVLVGLKLGLAAPCFGATIAISKTTLAMIGGLESVVDQLADDYALGAQVRRTGLTVAISATSVTHVCAQRSAGDLFRHEMRWARTIRSVDPFGFVGLAVTHALPLALLGMMLGGITPAGIMVVAALACRFMLQVELDRAFHLRDDVFWPGPFRDVVSFIVFVASFFGRAIEWRGHRYVVQPDSSLLYFGKIET